MNEQDEKRIREIVREEITKANKEAVDGTTTSYQLAEIKVTISNLVEFQQAITRLSDQRRSLSMGR